MKQIPNMLIFIHTDRLLKNNHSNWKSYDKPLPPILIWKSLICSYGETLITSHQGLSNQNAYLKRFFNQISILNQINQSHMLLVIIQLGESTFKFLSSFSINSSSYESFLRKNYLNLILKFFKSVDRVLFLYFTKKENRWISFNEWLVSCVKRIIWAYS